MPHKKKIETEQFAERLRRIMQDSGFRVSPSILAHEFNLRYMGVGITVTAASNWLNGNSVPKLDKLMTLANLFQVQPQEFLFDRARFQCLTYQLLECKQEMRVENVSAPDLAALISYRQLSIEHQRMVREVVLGFKSMKE